MHSYFCQAVMFEYTVSQYESTCNRNMCVHKTFWLTKESRKLLLKDYLPPTCPSLIWHRPKYTRSSHMLKQQGPQLSVQKKMQNAVAGLFAAIAVANWFVLPP